MPGQTAIDYSSLKITPGSPSECDDINALFFRSKEVWPWDEPYLKAYKKAFAITPDYIERNPLYVCTLNGSLIAFYSFINVDNDPTLDMIFVEPDWMGKGLGAHLWQHLCDYARRKNWSDFTLVSNLYAAPFYHHMGAKVIDRVQSKIPEGGVLPKMRYVL